MEQSGRMGSVLALPGLVALLLLGVATAPAVETVLPTVRPESETFHGPPVGYLRVFTTTVSRETGGSTYYFPHTDYKVCAPSGQVVVFVPNSSGSLSGAPATVELPPGKYLVHARSDRNGFVAVPVVIQGSHTTVVDLEDRPIGGYLDASGPLIAWKGGPSAGQTKTPSP